MARSFAGALLAGLLGSLLPVAAQSYPTRPVTIVVPYTPGGTTDNIIRLIKDKLAERLGQPVIIESRPGASGNLGTGVVARAEPDGYTLIIQPTTIGIFPQLFGKLSYDPVKDFALIGGIAETPSLLVVNATSPIKSLTDLVALARSKPGGANVGSGGLGGAGHLVIVELGAQNGFPVTHLPYRGTAPAVADMLSGAIDAGSMALGAVQGQIEGGVLRPLAVAALKRSALAPDVPTLVEAGMKGANGGVGYVLAAPAKTPRSVIDQVSRALDSALQEPDIIESMRKISFTPTPASPEDARKIVDEQTRTWGPVVERLGIKLD